MNSVPAYHINAAGSLDIYLNGSVVATIPRTALPNLTKTVLTDLLKELQNDKK
jgi:hypothetical protein